MSSDVEIACENKNQQWMSTTIHFKCNDIDVDKN